MGSFTKSVHEGVNFQGENCSEGECKFCSIKKIIHYKMVHYFIQGTKNKTQK